MSIGLTYWCTKKLPSGCLWRIVVLRSLCGLWGFFILQANGTNVEKGGTDVGVAHYVMDTSPLMEWTIQRVKTFVKHSIFRTNFNSLSTLIRLIFGSFDCLAIVWPHFPFETVRVLLHFREISAIEKYAFTANSGPKT